MAKYKLETVKYNNAVSILQVFQDGSRTEIARFLLPMDGQWRRDVDFHDEVMKAYKKRLGKSLNN